MSINFTGREGCPHVGASATSLVFSKVKDALDESRENLEATVNAKTAAEAARDEAAKALEDVFSAQDYVDKQVGKVEELEGDTERNVANAESAAEDAMSYRDEAEYHRGKAEAARDTAIQYSGNPAKPINGTWWIWNAETGEYEDTGASSVLSIQHSYHSVAAMNADFGNTSKNDMAIISSSVEEEDTAKLYINNGTEWVYLCDLSGVQGATGDAATVAVGTVTVGEAGSTPSVTNVGTSAAAVLNFVIPKGNTGDKGDTGNGISGITLASGNHAPGTLDTYTVQFTNGEEFSFQVYNGTNGSGAGDLMANGSVPMTGDLDAGGNKVTNLAAPVADTDAVRKSDLDSLIITSATQPTAQPVGGIWYEVLA